MVLPVCRTTLVAVAMLGVAASPGTPTEDDNKPEGEAKQKAEEQANKQLLGIKLGAAFGLTHSSEAAVVEAVLTNGLVRITKSQNANVGIWFETHRLFRSGDLFAKDVKTEAGVEISRLQAAIGPFVAVQSSNDRLLDALGAGLMIGFRQPGSDSGSINIGVGVALDSKYKVLGDGIQENQALPSGETEIRYREKSKFRLMVLFSFAP
jgi:hypothetical protein